MRPRVTFDISPELNARVEKRLPKGIKGQVMAALLESLISEIEANGYSVVSDILDKRMGHRRVLGGER